MATAVTGENPSWRTSSRRTGTKAISSSCICIMMPPRLKARLAMGMTISPRRLTRCARAPTSRLVGALAQRVSRRGLMVIPIASLAFSLGGIMMQMQEELIAFVPVLLLLVRQLGFSPVIAVAMSLGAAAVGAAFS